jgi:D-tyrosyl-tRNA(Tyr) deacylase
MRAVLQRVRSASVTIDGEVVGAIDAGLLVLAGAEADDSLVDVEWLAGKIVNLRLFETKLSRAAGSTCPCARAAVKSYS